MDKATLRETFGHFVGKEVRVITTPVGVMGHPAVQPSVVLDPQDPVIAAFRKATVAKGLTLRVFLPGSRGTMDVKETRLNAQIRQDDAGIWRIADTLRIG